MSSISPPDLLILSADPGALFVAHGAVVGIPSISIPKELTGKLDASPRLAVGGPEGSKDGTVQLTERNFSIAKMSFLVDL